MFRDHDLARKILLTAYSKASFGKKLTVEKFIEDDIPNETRESPSDPLTPYEIRFCEISDTIAQLADEGLIEIEPCPHFMFLNIQGYRIIRVTSAGHKYLEPIQDDSAWSAIKKNHGDDLKNISFSIATGLFTAWLSHLSGF